jgi:hypothetical protein
MKYVTEAGSCALIYILSFIKISSTIGTSWIGGWVGPRGGLDDVKT